MHSPSMWPIRPQAFARFVLLIAIALSFAQPLTSQTPTRDPLKRIFGVGDDEFFKGAWMKARPDTARAPDSVIWTQARQSWELADTLGINILRVQAEDFGTFRWLDSLLAGRRIDQRVISSHVGASINLFATGRQVRFYPFTGRDSVEYRTWRSRCTFLAAGTTELNPSTGGEKDVYGERALEQHYIRDSASVPTVIARDIIFG